MGGSEYSASRGFSCRLLLREEKIRRVQNEKSKEYFSVVQRVVASGGGAASFVGVCLVKSSDFIHDGQICQFPSRYEKEVLLTNE